MGTSLLVLLLLGVLQVHVHGYVPLECCCGPLGSNNSDGYCASCYQTPPCRNVPYQPFLPETVAEDSPLFLQWAPTTPRYEMIDNICYTYFRIDYATGQLLLFISEVYNDGSNNVRVCLVGLSSNGKLQFECFNGPAYGPVSDTAVAGVDVILNTLNTECNISAIYRCYEFESCQSDARGLDFRYGASSAKDVPLQCKIKSIKQANDPRYNFVDSSFLIFPNTKPFQCVTTFQGARSIGAEKVDAINSRSYP